MGDLRAVLHPELPGNGMEEAFPGEPEGAYWVRISGEWLGAALMKIKYKS